MTRKEDVIVLSYFDCIIRQSDLQILKSNGWLSDAIIGFYFSFLENERFKSNQDILFVGPEVSQCLKESPSEDVHIFLDPLDAKSKNYLFFAVNDSGKSAGGSHWSLLIFSRHQNKFYHLDSSLQTNCHPALKLARNLKKYFGLPTEIDFEELVSLQQDNSYDCGIFLICNLENVAEHIASKAVDIQHLPSIQRETVEMKRKYILDLIEDCKKHQH